MSLVVICHSLFATLGLCTFPMMQVLVTLRLLLNH